MKKYLPIIVTAVIVGVVCFFVGLQIGGGSGKSVAQSNPQGFQRGVGLGTGGRMGGLQQGGFAGGSIIAKDDKSITVSVRGGGSKIVFVSDTTEVMKSVQGTIADLATGEQVTVTGSANSDGSITAQSVQIRPTMPNATSTAQ